MYCNIERTCDYKSCLLDYIQHEYGIDGENIETDETKIPEYQLLAKVYATPVHGLTITREDFSYKNADKFFKQWHALDNMEICSLLEKYRVKLEHSFSRRVRTSRHD